MENLYLLELISCMEREIEDHNNGKYGDCEKHAGCKDRINTTISRIKEQITNKEDGIIECKLEVKSFKPAVCNEDQQAVRGEELEGAQLLEKLAVELDKLGINEEAEQARMHARELLASQLNEFDGFNFDSEEIKKGPAVVDKKPTTAAAIAEASSNLNS